MILFCCYLIWFEAFVFQMASAASPELVWQMIRNNHGSLMKARNIRKPFSKVLQCCFCQWQSNIELVFNFILLNDFTFLCYKVQYLLFILHYVLEWSCFSLSRLDMHRCFVMLLAISIFFLSQYLAVPAQCSLCTLRNEMSYSNSCSWREIL